MNKSPLRRRAEEGRLGALIATIELGTARHGAAEDEAHTAKENTAALGSNRLRIVGRQQQARITDTLAIIPLLGAHHAATAAVATHLLSVGEQARPRPP